MLDTTQQTAAGKVLWHFSMSLDGFVAGPGHRMDWMPDATNRPGLDRGVHPDHRSGARRAHRLGHVSGPRRRVRRAVERTDLRTHAPPGRRGIRRGVTFLNCDLGEAVDIARKAAGGKNVEVLSPTIGKQLLELGLLDEIDLHVLPVLLGDGIRLYDSPGGSPVALEFVNGDPVEEINLRYRPIQ